MLAKVQAADPVNAIKEKVKFYVDAISNAISGTELQQQWDASRNELKKIGDELTKSLGEASLTEKPTYICGSLIAL